MPGDRKRPVVWTEHVAIVLKRIPPNLHNRAMAILDELADPSVDFDIRQRGVAPFNAADTHRSYELHRDFDDNRVFLAYHVAPSGEATVTSLGFRFYPAGIKDQIRKDHRAYVESRVRAPAHVARQVAPAWAAPRTSKFVVYEFGVGKQWLTLGLQKSGVAARRIVFAGDDGRGSRRLAERAAAKVDCGTQADPRRCDGARVGGAPAAVRQVSTAGPTAFAWAVALQLALAPEARADAPDGADAETVDALDDEATTVRGRGRVRIFTAAHKRGDHVDLELLYGISKCGPLSWGDRAELTAAERVVAHELLWPITFTAKCRRVRETRLWIDADTRRASCRPLSRRELTIA